MNPLLYWVNSTSHFHQQLNCCVCVYIYILYIHTSSLSISLLTGTQVAFISWLLYNYNSAMNTGTRIFLYSCFRFLWLDTQEQNFFTVPQFHFQFFEELPQFFIFVALIYIPTNSAGRFPFLHILLSTLACCFFILAILKM